MSTARSDSERNLSRSSHLWRVPASAFASAGLSPYQGGQSVQECEDALFTTSSACFFASAAGPWLGTMIIDPSLGEKRIDQWPFRYSVTTTVPPPAP